MHEPADNLHASTPSTRRAERAGLVLLAILLIGLLPAWPLREPLLLEGGGLSSSAGPPQPSAQQYAGLYVAQLTELMTGYLLPLSLGMLLAVRAGTVDLSLWAVAWTAGLVAARLGQAGLSPALAGVAVVLAGAGSGFLCGALARWARIPAVVSTLIVAAVLTWLAPAIGGAPAGTSLIASEAAGFDGQGLAQLGPRPGRMLLAALGYVAVMASLVGASSFDLPRLFDRKARILLALTVSGALAAMGGLARLAETGRAVVFTRPIGDLRLVAAVVLTGAMVLRGRNRTMLAGLVLPLGLAAATIWQLRVWWLPVEGYDAQLLVLAVLAAGVHFAALLSVPLASIAGALAGLGALGCGLGLALLVGSAHPDRIETVDALRAAGAWTGAIGLALLAAGAAARALARRGRRTPA
jgi:ribose/xylose/arabinose/galactoside ABC-type transport system permease subunit